MTDKKDWSKPEAYDNDDDAVEVVAVMRSASSGPEFEKIDGLRLKIEEALADTDVRDALTALSVVIANGLVHMPQPCKVLESVIVPLIHANVHGFLARDGRQEGANGKKLDS